MKKVLLIFSMLFLSFGYTVFSQEAMTSTESVIETASSSPVIELSSETKKTDENQATTTSPIDTAVPATVPAETIPEETNIAAEAMSDTPATEETSRKRDIVPPERISDLAVERTGGKSLVVGWTVPYDDSGKVKGYDARLSREPIDENSWNSAISFPGSPGENTSGAQEKMEFNSLPEGTTLYVAIKAYDEDGNISALSNSVQTTTKTKTSFSFSETGGLLASAGFVKPEYEKGVGEHSSQSDAAVSFGTVKLALQKPDGLPVGTPIFVNFINTITGLSYGGPSVNGFVSYKIPAGDYYARMIIIDTAFKEPREPIFFHISADEEKDLGIVRLTAADIKGSDASILAEAEKKGGVAKLLIVIIKFLEEILATLQKIAVKLNA